MRSGRLRHRCVLQSKTYVQDATGAEVVSWSTEATVWGAIEPFSGKEYFAEGQLQSESSVRIVLRQYSGLDSTWRIVNGGESYAITDVLDDDEVAHLMTLHCLSGVKEVGSLPVE